MRKGSQHNCMYIFQYCFNYTHYKKKNWQKTHPNANSSYAWVVESRGLKFLLYFPEFVLNQKDN